MKRRHILSLSVITALGLALLPGSALSQQKSLQEQLTGTWTLVSNDNVAPDGTKRQLYGPNPKGILILDAGGKKLSKSTQATGLRELRARGVTAAEIRKLAGLD